MHVLVLVEQIFQQANFASNTLNPPTNTYAHSLHESESHTSIEFWSIQIWYSISKASLPYPQDTLAEYLNTLDSPDHGLGAQRSEKKKPRCKKSVKVSFFSRSALKVADINVTFLIKLESRKWITAKWSMARRVLCIWVLNATKKKSEDKMLMTICFNLYFEKNFFFFS